MLQEKKSTENDAFEAASANVMGPREKISQLLDFGGMQLKILNLRKEKPLKKSDF